jgi:imidazolonepropionase-like amidohydrolase/Tol biopolymer transport system component
MESYDAFRIGMLLDWAEMFAAILTVAVVVGITVFVLMVLSGTRQESRRGRDALPGAAPRRRAHSTTLHGWVILCLLLAACSGSPVRPAGALAPEPGHGPIAGGGAVPVSFVVEEGSRLAFDISPDGGWLVFDLLGQLWRVEMEGGAAEPLTDAVRDTAEDLDPVISPDGEWLVFQGDRPGGRALWRMPAAGGEAVRLTERYVEYFAYAAPAWAPDGRRVAFALGDTLAVLDVWTGAETVVSIDSIPDPVTAHSSVPRNGSPAWHPDGDRLAFVNAGGDGRIWEVAAAGGQARPLTEGRATAPAYSPDGARLAFFARDSAGSFQLWVQPTGAAPVQLTRQEDLAVRRARWLPDGTAILYSAEGRLWRVPATGGEPEAIPFTARISFDRLKPHLPSLRFPEPGSVQQARGYSSLALAPDGQGVAIIALDSLWLWRPGAAPRALAPVPASAGALEWSPDGREVAWVGTEGFRASHLFITDVETGTTRQRTAFPGAVAAARWSPDGQRLAVVHGNRLRLLEAAGERVAEPDSTVDLGSLQDLGDLAWTPDSRALVGLLWNRRMSGGAEGAARILLDGTREAAPGLPGQPVNLGLHGDGTATWVHGNQLWRAARYPDPSPGSDPVTATSDASGSHTSAPGAGEGVGGLAAAAWSEDAATEASYAADGSTLYVAADGLRLRRPDGSVRTLGWPLTYRVPEAPAPLLVRDVRIIDGLGAGPSDLSDILVEGGRIARIAPAGSIAAGPGVTVVGGGGRMAIPGLIDLHTHLFEGVELALPGWLHAGVTTVREVGSQRPQGADLRNLLAAGIRPGPRVVAAVGMFHGGDGYSTIGNQFVSDSAAVARGMAVLAGLGAPHAKERSFQNWWGAVNVVREAHRHGMRVTSHCAHILPIVAAGLDGREHTTDCSRDASPRADITHLARAAGMWAVPTAGMFLANLELIQDPSLLESPAVAPFLAPQWHAFYAGSAEQRAFYEENVRRRRVATRRFHEAGVRLGAGTDVPFPLALHFELEALVAAGLSPMEAIVAATGTGAEVLGSPDVGVLEVGRLADLVILDADPLEDIRNTRLIGVVIQGGRVVDREALRGASRGAAAQDEPGQRP